MKLFKRILAGILVVVAVVVVGGLIYLNYIKTDALPDYNENIALPGLDDQVVVLRDSFAIPHVYAQNETDLYKAVGYLMAQDRLWQMDLLRRVTTGRLSEIFGNRMANTDLLMRALRIQDKSEKIMQTIDPRIGAALEAFTEGVNHYIANHPLPPEFRILGYEPEAWQPVHSVNLIGYMAWDLSSGWTTEMTLYKLSAEVDSQHISELIPEPDKHPIPIFPDFKLSNQLPEGTLLAAAEELEKLGVVVFTGSNNWAVSGKKSKTGMPLLANDMHLGLFAPGIWYQMHQVAGNDLNVTGLVLPGQPFAIVGHNDSIAWGMTNVMVDDLDFYAETVNADTTQYLLDGQWKDLQVRKEVIKTKEGEELHKVLRFTHRGPIVNEFKNEKDQVLSVRWLGNEMSNEMRSVFLLNRASNWGDFRDALTTFKSISQNVVYADVKGNIGLQTSAGIPIRKGSPITIYPGDTTASDWSGLVPFEELPYEYNPERGYVSSANNRTVPDSYPYYISYWYALPNRIARIRELLEATDQHDAQTFSLMQGDVKSKKAELFVPVFIKALEEKDAWVAAEKTALAALQQWDYSLDRESMAAALFEVLYRKTAENLVQDELSPDLYKTIMGERVLIENLMVNILDEGTQSWTDNVKTPVKENYADIVQQAFSETVAGMVDKYGEDLLQWQWGDLHTITISHPLGSVNVLNMAFNFNRGPFAVPGSYHTVCPYSYSYNNLYQVNHGASHRNIYDTNNWNSSKTVIPTGTSGIPSSSFYLDQTDLYLANLYHDDPYTREAVEGKALFRMTFVPE